MQPKDYLSARALENLSREVNWRDLRKTLSKPYDSVTRPDGRINLGLAESTLMHQELATHIKANFEIDLAAHLTYGSGPNGSPLLLQALSRFINRRFGPVIPVTGDELIISSGLAAAIDCLTWNICDEGDGILVPQPFYAGFITDIELRSRARVLPVSYRRKGRPYHLLDAFDPEITHQALQDALEKYDRSGVKIRAVLISNPHNPLGRCHSTRTLQEIARFCQLHEMHLISDEIYANSTFRNPSCLDAEPFRSLLSIDLASLIHPERVHVLYGMSKDFCANGLRLGAVHTRNAALREAMATLNIFSWPAYVTQDMWARILLDEPFIEKFIGLNQDRLANCYTTFTSFLDKYEIPYLPGGNAGFFIWTRLIREPATRTPEAAHKSVLSLKEELLGACLSNGLFIRDGAKYFDEAPEGGWFRITFTVDEHILEVATTRLLKSLRETGLLCES
ncbi:unnamed protein product [Clonostachys solani]|uniref:Aminotransferase class I/classII large domain-containing protein n=1 Tax=Clonostachys solani TaxID=160281 RepID=A0A9N9ZG58_9HYPO|nr:unnamed protein product [Clonostachys solani]